MAPTERRPAGDDQQSSKGGRVAVLVFLLLTVVFAAVVTYGVTNIRIQPVPGEPAPARDGGRR
jgi:hypothetical protein